MIISIDDHIIETEHIVSISDIKYYMLGPISKVRCESYLDAEYIKFDIIFSNKNSIIIKRDLLTSPRLKWNLTMNRVKLARKQLIKLWTPDRDPIPTITID